MDLSAAFITINHGVFPDSLTGMGLEGTKKQWLLYRSFIESGAGRLLFNLWPMGFHRDLPFCNVSLHVHEISGRSGAAVEADRSSICR